MFKFQLSVSVLSNICARFWSFVIYLFLSKNKEAKKTEAAFGCLNHHLMDFLALEEALISRGSGCYAKREMAVADVT